VSAFIESERGRFGVERICQVLDVSASACYQRASGERSARQVEDERLLELVRADPDPHLLRLRLLAVVAGAPTGR
jgi:hypothetical protein